MHNIKKETYLKILFLLSSAILIIAYAIQYIFGYQPCNLCIIERIPFMVALIILISNYYFKKNELFHCILLIFNSGYFVINIQCFPVRKGSYVMTYFK